MVSNQYETKDREERTVGKSDWARVGVDESNCRNGESVGRHPYEGQRSGRVEANEDRRTDLSRVSSSDSTPRDSCASMCEHESPFLLNFGVPTAPEAACIRQCEP